MKIFTPHTEDSEAFRMDCLLIGLDHTRGADCHQGMGADIFLGHIEAALNFTVEGVTFMRILMRRLPELATMYFMHPSLQQAKEQSMQILSSCVEKVLPTLPAGLHVKRDAQSVLEYCVQHPDDLRGGALQVVHACLKLHMCIMHGALYEFVLKVLNRLTKTGTICAQHAYTAKMVDKNLVELDFANEYDFAAMHCFGTANPTVIDNLIKALAHLETEYYRISTFPQLLQDAGLLLRDDVLVQKWKHIAEPYLTKIDKCHIPTLGDLNDASPYKHAYRIALLKHMPDINTITVFFRDLWKLFPQIPEKANAKETAKIHAENDALFNDMCITLQYYLDVKPSDMERIWYSVPQLDHLPVPIVPFDSTHANLITPLKNTLLKQVMCQIAVGVECSRSSAIFVELMQAEFKNTIWLMVIEQTLTYMYAGENSPLTSQQELLIQHGILPGLFKNVERGTPLSDLCIPQMCTIPYAQYTPVCTAYGNGVIICHNEGGRYRVFMTEGQPKVLGMSIDPDAVSHGIAMYMKALKDAFGPTITVAQLLQYRTDIMLQYKWFSETGSYLPILLLYPARIVDAMLFNPETRSKLIYAGCGVNGLQLMRITSAPVENSSDPIILVGTIDTLFSHIPVHLKDAWYDMFAYLDPAMLPCKCDDKHGAMRAQLFLQKCSKTDFLQKFCNVVKMRYAGMLAYVQSPDFTENAYKNPPVDILQWYLLPNQNLVGRHMMMPANVCDECLDDAHVARCIEGFPPSTASPSSPSQALLDCKYHTFTERMTMEQFFLLQLSSVQKHHSSISSSTVSEVMQVAGFRDGSYKVRDTPGWVGDNPTLPNAAAMLIWFQQHCFFSLGYEVNIQRDESQWEAHVAEVRSLRNQPHSHNCTDPTCLCGAEVRGQAEVHRGTASAYHPRQPCRRIPACGAVALCRRCSCCCTWRPGGRADPYPWRLLGSSHRR